MEVAYDEDEWHVIMNDDSFLSLVNLSECNAETTVDEDPEEMDENIGIPPVAESIITSQMDVEY